MSHLVAIGGAIQGKRTITRDWNYPRFRGNELELEVALDELAEFFAIFVAHVHEFDAASVRTDVSDDGGEIDLAETGSDFELDGVANTELLGGLQISAAQADGLYTRKPRWCALDLRAKRRVERNSRVAAGNDIA